MWGGRLALKDLAVDPAVARFLRGYDGHRSKLACLSDFLVYISSRDGFEGFKPFQFVEFQRNAGKDDAFKILDVLQEYILQKPGTLKTLTTRYSFVRSFFRKNRAPLPDDDFRIKGNREPNRGKLSLDVIKTLVHAVGLEMKAFYLSMFTGIMDLERFSQFNLKAGRELAEHLKSKGVGDPFLLEYSGRKQSKNRAQFYTFIGRDALAAWHEYFERIRGWPKDKEPLLLDRYGRPLSKEALMVRHKRILEKLKYVKFSGGSAYTRYGYNLHEFRDVARTLLHLQGRKDQLDMDCVEFWMGHITDPNNYDKFYLDKEYVLRQYRIAEKYLNLISGTSGSENHTAELEKRLTQYQNVAAEALTRLNNLEAIVERIKKIEGERKKSV